MNNGIEIGISAMGYALAPKVDIFEVGKNLDITIEELIEFRNKHKIQTIAYGPDTKSEKLAYNAIMDLKKRHNNFKPEEVDVLIVCYTEQSIPSFQSLPLKIKSLINLRNARSFSINGVNCTSVVMSIKIARNMLLLNPEVNQILIVGVDSSTENKGRILRGIALMGDGACALLLTRNPKISRLEHVENIIEGSLYKGIRADEKDLEKFNLIYFLISKKLIMLMIKHLGISLQEIDLILPHNISYASWEHFLKIINVPIEKVYLKNQPHIGHVYTSDNVINFQDSLDEGIIQKDDRVLFFTVGLGACWAAASFIIM